MPLSSLDLLLALAPTGMLVALAWMLRWLLAAANARPVPEPERHPELLPAYARADS